ncbi:Protein-export membrane protein SecF [Candidatus Bilamarchaeum dharawalense]|uniref:Protein-export membrane protein SecF n=1 Tax=Candidatus Bilamarchaeum dharawalense TaxID=2885759 RepID=A0A5E4LRE7_9ARCH|nr:Protein-export membrane protein SecF [Candidatus Bilamarchaeum dharawalense]
MLPNIYKGNYVLLAIFPIILIALSLYFIPSIKLGVDFQGGTLVTLSLKENVNAEELQNQLKTEGLDASVQVFQTAVGTRAEIEVPQSQNLIKADDLRTKFNTLLPEVTQLEVANYQNATFDEEYKAKKAELDGIADEMFGLAGKDRNKLNISSTNELQQAFTQAYSDVYKNYQDSISQPINKHVQYDSISVQTVSPALTTHFIEVATNIVILSIALSLILVFIFFRTVAPSLAVLLGALSDITIALGAMGLLGVPLTLASFAALLMLLAFSLDTDILLTTRLLKRKGDPRENAFDAMKTGMTMSIMAMIAFLALFILASLTHIPTYYEISAVAIAGLVGDIFATWGINGVIILYYVEHRRRA